MHRRQHPPAVPPVMFGAHTPLPARTTAPFAPGLVAARRSPLAASYFSVIASLYPAAKVGRFGWDDRGPSGPAACLVSSLQADFRIAHHSIIAVPWAAGRPVIQATPPGTKTRQSTPGRCPVGRAQHRLGLGVRGPTAQRRVTCLAHCSSAKNRTGRQVLRGCSGRCTPPVIAIRAARGPVRWRGH
jgi:hypothetical protein